MQSCPPKFGPVTPLGDRHPARRCLIRSTLLLLLLGLLGGNAAANTDAQKVPVNSVGPGQPFAIADLDGDVRPDLASIQAGSSTSGTTDYWIQLRLTTAGWRSIRLVAPAGGLWIEARDVNGDHAVDLVFSTAWLRRPVAILLNNGHGSFSRVEPAAFPGAFAESESNWASGSGQVTDAVGVPPQSRTQIFLQRRGLPYPKAQADFTSLSTKGLFLSPFLTSHLGRAPPSQSSRL
jgi:hypothetical protein